MVYLILLKTCKFRAINHKKFYHLIFVFIMKIELNTLTVSLSIFYVKKCRCALKNKDSQLIIVSAIAIINAMNFY